MIERLVVLVALALAVCLITVFVQLLARRRTAAVQGTVLPDRLRARFPTGGPGIVYFYGPHCGTCRQQAAILDRLAVDGMVGIVRVDAALETELAAACGVMTVPATIVVSEQNRVRAVNLGLRSMDVLKAQLLGQVQQENGAA